MDAISIKRFVRAYSPEWLISAIKPSYFMIMSSIASFRAKKYLPYYQDDLSKQILFKRINFYRTRNQNFTEYIIKQGMRLKQIAGINIKDYSGICVIYDKENYNLKYIRDLLSLCEWSEKHKFITLQEFLNGEKISDTELIIPALNSRNSKKFYSFIDRNKLKLNIHKGPLYSIREDVQYFDVFSPVKDEIIIDAGAYDCETALRFLEWGGENVKQIYSFELDPVNFVKCKEKIKGHEEKITLLNKGTWDKDEITYIAGSGGTGSSVSHGGNVKINLTSIDNVVKDNAVTFIKMDVEGAELKSLIGARNTIIKNRPRLAICVYHMLQDIYEIPGYILSLVPDYKFYLRHYSANQWETILYAYCE